MMCPRCRVLNSMAWGSAGCGEERAEGSGTAHEELGDGDEPEHVRLEHLLDVRVRDRADLLAALHEPGIVDCVRSDQLAALRPGAHTRARTEDVDSAQLGRDALEQARDLRLVADVELDRRDLAAGADLRLGVRGCARVRDLLQRVLSAREQDQVRAGLGAPSQNMQG
jgi:hypothetical protein